MRTLAEKLSRRVHKAPSPSILLPNIQTPENKLDRLYSRLSYQRDLKNCNIAMFLGVVTEHGHG